MRYFVIYSTKQLDYPWIIAELDTELEQPKVVLSGSFLDIYSEFLKKFQHQPIFIDKMSSQKRLIDDIEDLGYDPIPERYFISWIWLAQIVFPKHRPESFHHLPNTAPEHAVRHMLTTLKSLPFTTLQSFADICVDVPVFQEIVQELLLQNMQSASPREQFVEVLHNVAFQPVTIDMSPATIESDDDDHLILDDFSEYCTEFYRQRLREWTGTSLEDRPGQLELIKSVANALAEDQILIAEAGTGTGKSLAYLLPAALFSRQTGEKAVISTHTIALQEQLRKKDLPMLRALLREPIRYAILKGRNHYLCLRKLARHLHSQVELTHGERDFVLKTAVWVTETVAGDREEIALSAQELTYWQLVQSETESCINKKCPFFRFCYYFSAKQLAADADLILVNHSLVLSDLATENRILPRYKRLILDEAHHLEDQATKHFGTEVFQFDLTKIIERTAGSRGLLPDLRRNLVVVAANSGGIAQTLLQQLEQMERIIQQIGDDLKKFWSELTNWSQQLPLKSEMRITGSVVAEKPYEKVNEAAKWLGETRKQLAQSYQKLEELRLDLAVEDPFFDRVADLAGRINELLHGLQVCVHVALVELPENEYVGWVATGGQGKNMSLQLAPLSVALVLKRELFSDKDTVVLTSATLSVAKSFHYIKQRTGLALLEGTERITEKRMESPFSYSQQALLCIPDDLPDVRSDAMFIQAAAEAIIHIAKISAGRTMVLFTSRQMLQQVYQLTQHALAEHQLILLAQGIHDHRRTHLLEQFRNTARTILFGLDSFWEGVDVQGEALTSLIIVKLPFPVPSHPVVEARSELIRQAGKQPFYEYSIPQAVIRFTQGFGRLIRAQSDHGVVFVLDKRIITERYGHIFLKSLPDIPILRGTLAETCKTAQDYV